MHLLTTTSPGAASLAGLPAISYGAHRGGRHVGPENTLVALRAARDAGVDWVEMDAQRLGDGTVVIFHDSTVDRVTSGSGPLSALTVQAYKTLRTKAGQPSPAWPATELATAAEVLDALGGTIVLVIECKTADVIAPLAEMVHARGLSGSVVLATHRPDDIPAIRCTGLTSLLWRGHDDGSAADAQACATAGADILQIRYTWEPELIDAYALAAGGGRLWSDCSPRRVDRDRLIARGVTGLVSDDPLYLSGRLPRATTDIWRWGAYGNGDLVSSGARPAITPAGRLLLQRPGHIGMLPGSVAEVSGTYTVSLTAVLAAPAVSGTPWVGVFLGADTDRPWQDAAADGTTGYLCLVNSSGNAYVYRKDPGGSVLLGSYNGPNLAVGAEYRLNIQVTPAALTFHVPGVTAPVTVQDSTYRGGYIHLGAKGDGVAAWHVGALDVPD